MQFGPWAAALIASTLGGAAVCGALVVRRRWIAACLALVVLAVASDIAACAAIWAMAHRADGLIAALALSVASGVGGFALGAALLSARTTPQDRHVEPVVGPAAPGTHVIILADAEPEEYDPAAVTAALHRFGDSDLDLPPELARPLIYASERARYHRTGGSPARGVVHCVAKALHARLVRDGGDFGVTTALCTGTPTLEDAVAGIVARGGRRIVVAPLAPAWSPAFSRASAGLPSPALAAAGVKTEVASPLWASEHLSAMIAQRVVSALGGDRSADGVILMSEGDPWELDRTHDQYREQLTFLIQRVRAELIHAGVAPERIKRAWLWLEEPDIAEAARHLSAVGARNIVIAPVTYPTETISTLVDARYAAERAAGDTGTAVTFIAPWGDDPAVAESLTEAVLTAMKRFDQR